MQKESMLICYPGVVPQRGLDFRLQYRTLLVPSGLGTAFIILRLGLIPNMGSPGKIQSWTFRKGRVRIHLAGKYELTSFSVTPNLL
jgi:hypothetical protein